MLIIKNKYLLIEEKNILSDFLLKDKISNNIIF